MSQRVEELEERQARPDDIAAAEAVLHVDRCIDLYITRCRKKIPSFVSANFSLEQTWRLQRRTLWFDLACAPVNSGWALPHLAVQKIAQTAEKLGFPHLARRAKHLPSGITTGYQREIERRICRDLLEWDFERSAATLPQGLLKELDGFPSVRRRIEALDSAHVDSSPARALSDLLHQFSSGRAIVSDLFGSLLTLAMSWWMMGSTSLGLQGIARGMAKKNAHDRAASRFFLGKKAGNAFYNVFPPAVDERTIWTILVVLGALLTAAAMACTILSDPIRKVLGLHRNRLETLLDEMERELIVHAHKRLRSG